VLILLLTFRAPLIARPIFQQQVHTAFLTKLQRLGYNNISNSVLGTLDDTSAIKEVQE